MHDHVAHVEQLADYLDVTKPARPPEDLRQLKVLGERLGRAIDEKKKALRAAGEKMPAEKVATDAGVPNATIKVYRIALREPGALTLRALAVSLGVSTDYLLGLTDDPAPAGTKPKRHKSSDAA